MTDELTNEARHGIAEYSRRLYERRMVAGRGGNVSIRLASGNILITPHGACLSSVRAEDLSEINLDGQVLSGGRPSTESRLHLAIYRELPVHAIVHAHPICATAVTLSRSSLEPPTFETLLALGEVRVVAQDTPTVIETDPVVDALRTNNAVLLRRHGSVSVGENIEDAYLLTELVEEAAELVIAASRLGATTAMPLGAEAATANPTRINGTSEGLLPSSGPDQPLKADALFSVEHIAAVVALVNRDEEALRRGVATHLTTRLGIRLDERGILHNIHLVEGRVAALDHDENVDYLISGPESSWRQVFAGRVDPFVAVTQKRLKLRGDLGKLSRWYSPFCRVFELWKQVPFE